MGLRGWVADFLKDRVGPWPLLRLRGLRLGLVRVECGRGHSFASRNAKCTDQLHEWTLVTSDPVEEMPLEKTLPLI